MTPRECKYYMEGVKAFQEGKNKYSSNPYDENKQTFEHHWFLLGYETKQYGHAQNL